MAIDSKDSAPDMVEPERALSQVEHVYDLDGEAKVSDYKADAVEAENAEHNMGVLQAVRAYPMASFWAFVMSCTIVSSLPLLSRLGNTANKVLRSWSLTMSS